MADDAVQVHIADIGQNGEDPKKEKPTPPKFTLRVFRYGTAFDFFLLFIGCVTFAGTGVLLPIFMLLFGDLINSIGDPTNSDKSFNYYVKIQLIIAAASFVLSWSGTTCMEWAAERQLRNIRKNFLKAVLRQEIGWFDSFDSGTLPSRLNQNCVEIRDAIGVKLGQLFMFVSMFIGGYVVGFIKGWKLALVVSSSLPLLAAGGFFMMYAISSVGEMSRKGYAAAGGVAEESIRNMRTIASFGAEKITLKRYVANLDPAFWAGVKTGIGGGVGMGFIMGILFLTYALGFWYGGVLVAQSIESGCLLSGDCFRGGSVLAVLFSVVIAAFALGQAGPNITAFTKGSGAASNLFEVIDRKSLIDSMDTKGITDWKLEGDIVFKNAKFAFPSRPDKLIFQSLNLHIPAGKTVALVGASGCGKSTTVQLLERFYDLIEGDVELDGRNVKDFNLRWLRSQMAIVSQEPRLFPISILDNISHGKLGSSKEEIIEAAKNANAHKFISEFPDGYNTLVGSGGSQLSGGQKQRIAIARAILRDPRILILDEATSALDNESEKIVQQTLDELILQKKRTTIVIAHRLTTIRNADIIVVLDNPTNDGSIVAEQGSHDELMTKENGLYKNLVLSQSLPDEERLKMAASYKISVDFGLQSVGSLSVRSRAPSKLGSFHALSLKYGSKENLADDVKVEAVQEKTVTKCGCIPVKKKVKGEGGERPAPPFTRVAKKLAPDAWKVIFAMLGAGVNGCTYPIFAIIFSELVGVYFLMDPRTIRSKAAFWALMFVALAGSVFLSLSCQSSFFSWAGHRLVRELRHDTFEAIVHQDISFFDDPANNEGSLSQLLSTEILLVKGWVGDNTGLLFQNFVCLVGGLVIAFLASPQLAAVVLVGACALAPAGVLQMSFMKGSGDKTSKSAEAQGAFINQPINEIRMVSSYCLEEEVQRLYMKMVNEEYRTGRKNAFIFGGFFGFSQFANFGIQALALWYGGKLVAEGKISNIQDMMKAIFALIMAAMGFGETSVFLTDVNKAKRAAANVFYILDLKPKINVRDDNGRILDEKFVGDIRFKDVNFRYPQRPESSVYKSITFDVKPGETVALVGESGCGKSTVVQLLQRFYDVALSGTGEDRLGGVFVDQIDVRDFNLRYLRGQMGLVSQEPVLFSSSIEENIKYGNETATHEEVVKAAQMANADDFIKSFPEGYGTEVGKGGGQLSGGQKQRIAIARAMIRNPKILLLDEATSALDAESEKIVQEALDRLLKQTKRTTIIIAHRLSTVRNADKIIVLSNEEKEGSQVAEFGTHQSLMDIPNGIYANLLKIAEASASTEEK